MGDKPRRPIRQKVSRMVMIILMTALLVTSGMGLLSMFRIRRQGESALVGRMENEITTLAKDRAELADTVLSGYAKDVDRFAAFVEELYKKPEDYVKKTVEPPLEANDGKLSLQLALESEVYKAEDIEEEAELLGNVEQIFYPVMSSDDGVITSVYVATESGFMLAYDTQSAIKAPFPYSSHFDRDWYNAAKETGGTVFSDVYQDLVGRGLTITCAEPFYRENGEVAGVVGMDILISNLYNSVVAVDLGNDDAYAFMTDSKGNAISPDSSATTIDDDPELDEATRSAIRSGETGVKLTDKGFYYSYAPVECTNWMFCTHVPRSYVLEPVKNMDSAIRILIFLFVVVFIAVIVCMTVVVRRFSETLTKPLLALGEDAKKISEGDLEHQAVIHDNDEIGDLAMRFNEMGVSLKSYIEDLTKVTAEKERIGAELNVATQIQADMLPRIFPTFADKAQYDMYATMNPAKEVGGDFYDFFMVDDTHLGLVMADVSGKGVPAALFMVIAKTLIKNRAIMGGSPAEVLSYANDQLCEGNEAELFVTVWLAILDITTGKGVAANAGHEHPAIRRAGGDFELSVYRHSPAVATMEGMRFKEHEFELGPGDSLFVYTDGVAEATDANNELFGTERMLAALNRDPGATATEMLRNVKTAVDEFVGEAPQFDDITMLGIRYFGGQ
ncbi:MAG: SpoIIE family protein phosphatase [Lachnospiraceae bacterium]|nr:SpoIIE family protein phosphatase [Lachnospiraceae bacterium]